MTSDAPAAHAFATLRFAGDSLDPAELSGVLRVEPTIAYRKGERYRIGGEKSAVGKTGLWMITTEGRFPEQDLRAHLDAIAYLIAADPKHPARDERLAGLRAIVQLRRLEPVATVFWHGPSGARVPSIHASFRDLVARIHGAVEEDFYRPEPAQQRARA